MRMLTRSMFLLASVLHAQSDKGKPFVVIHHPPVIASSTVRLLGEHDGGPTGVTRRLARADAPHCAGVPTRRDSQGYQQVSILPRFSAAAVHLELPAKYRVHPAMASIDVQDSWDVRLIGGWTSSSGVSGTTDALLQIKVEPGFPYVALPEGSLVESIDECVLFTSGGLQMHLAYARANDASVGRRMFVLGYAQMSDGSFLSFLGDSRGIDAKEELDAMVRSIRLSPK